MKIPKLYGLVFIAISILIVIMAIHGLPGDKDITPALLFFPMGLIILLNKGIIKTE